MKKILFFIGTRPEAIKLAPLIIEFRKSNLFDIKVCLTAQHRDLLDSVIELFKIEVDFDLDLMTSDQTLHQITSDIIVKTQPIISNFKPDYIFVQGDTTTAMACSLSSFYCGVKVCHIEAGLRTNNKIEPFPEEINRQIISKIADYNFAPTKSARDNLIKENTDKNRIYVTGNTVIDALFYVLNNYNPSNDPEIERLQNRMGSSEKIILVTGHRRENHSEGIKNLCLAVNQLAKDPGNIIIWPVHPNPNVTAILNKHLKKSNNMIRLKPLRYEVFTWLMSRSYLIITDSGGIQEEAPSLGKPVIVTRNLTERSEALEAGTVLLAGTDSNTILEQARKLLNDHNLYNDMGKIHNPYGDGKTSAKILEIMKNL